MNLTLSLKKSIQLKDLFNSFFITLGLKKDSISKKKQFKTLSVKIKFKSCPKLYLINHFF